MLAGARNTYYDVETGLYYLQSRYYNPQWGRFINADGYVSTGQGLLGNNMFAYCGNNPIMYVDPTGDFPWIIAAFVVAVVAAIGVDHYLASEHSEGVQAISDIDGNALNDRTLYARGHGFSANQNEMTICDMQAGVYSGVAEYKNGQLSLATFLTASAIAQIDYSGVPSLKVEGIASAYSMIGEYTFTIGSCNITVGGALHVGAIGAAIEFDSDHGNFKIAPPSVGIVPSFGIDFDWD